MSNSKIEPKEKKTSKKPSKKPSKKTSKKEKIYCGIENPIPKNYRLGSMKECFDAGKVMYYGIKKVDSKVLKSNEKNNDNDEKTIQLKKVGLIGKLGKIKKKISTVSGDEKATLLKEYNLLVKEINELEDKIKKLKNK
jgi:hypothetical protein